jgi:hypothetical protein
VFCDVSCWDAHVPMMNHRESWAEERTAPTYDDWVKELSGENKTPRKRTPKEAAAEAPAPVAASAPKVILRRPRSE